MKKAFNWLVKVHHNSSFSVHKTISRLFGLCLLFELSRADSMYVLAISILATDLFFLVKGKKEHIYKSASFFENSKITKDSIDLYYKWMTIIKAVIFIPTVAFLGIIAFGGISIFMVPIMASIFKFTPFMPDQKDSFPS